jgi:hypothetical protein
MPPTCAQMCRTRCKERSREMGDDNPFTEVESTWLAMSDEQIFKAVRSDDNDHFTYEEFLKQRGWEDSSDAQEFFDRYVAPCVIDSLLNSPTD